MNATQCKAIQDAVRKEREAIADINYYLQSAGNDAGVKTQRYNHHKTVTELLEEQP